jgi:hypothetical protein
MYVWQRESAAQCVSQKKTNLNLPRHQPQYHTNSFISQIIKQKPKSGEVIKLSVQSKSGEVCFQKKKSGEV